MEIENSATLIFRFRVAMMFFIIGLILSGVTAFPLLGELKILTHWLGLNHASGPAGSSGIDFWILTVRHGLEDMYEHYPWIAYGTDWLAFGHLVIAMFFVGSLIHPLSSRMNIYTGIVACLSIIPLAMICGPIRGIPFYWRLIDCSFGILGILPLIYCLRILQKMEETSLAATK